MTLQGNCLTTAMGILPHKDIDRALLLALSVDIPFWPQLPRVSFYEDMYVQLSEHFPGIRLDPGNARIELDMEAFYNEMGDYSEHWENPAHFRLSPRYSSVYDRFLARDLSGFPAIRGQSIGPISFGLKITDTSKTPIIYHDEVREIIYDFIARKVRAQYNDLKAKNQNAFVWVDEPGLEMIFMGFTGYASERAIGDYRHFLDQLPAPRGVHLCGNPDWSFLLDLGLDILSVDTLAWGYIFTKYTEGLRAFIERGGIISWGITPTLSEELDEYPVNALLQRLEEMWNGLAARGIDKQQLLSQSWLAPARCCLINLDGSTSVERSFALLKEISLRIREHYSLE